MSSKLIEPVFAACLMLDVCSASQVLSVGFDTGLDKISALLGCIAALVIQITD